MRSARPLPLLLALGILASGPKSASPQVANGNAEAGYVARARAATPRPLSLGSPVEGALAAGDPAFDDGSRFQVWAFSARAGEERVLALESSEFDGLLMLVAADGETQQLLGVESANRTSRVANLAFRAPRGGDYLVVVSSQRPRATGRYRLSLNTLADGCTGSGQCTVEDVGLTPLSRIDPRDAPLLSVGASNAGDLSRTDARMLDSSYFDAWRYEGTAGERIVIDHISPVFDTYLILARQTSNGPVSLLENDDAPFTANSRIAVELPETATYIVIATYVRNRRDTTGRYELRVRPLAQACADGGPCEPTVPGERRPFFAPVRNAPSQVITLGDSVAGRLSRTDRTLGDETFFDAYRFAGTANSEVAIFLSARTPSIGRLDTYLHLLRLEGDSLIAVQSDDDGGGGKNSLVTARLPRTGEYFVVANGLTMADTGDYTLTALRLADACTRRQVCEIGARAPDLSIVQAILQAPAQRIVAGTPVTAELTGHGPKLPGDKPFEAWRYTARRGERIVITNHSSDFDAYLYLYKVVGNSVREMDRNDDGGGGLDAQLAVELAEAGDYLVIAGSFSAGARGDYRLTLEPMAVACAAGGPCAPGETSAATARIRPALQAAHLPLPLVDTLRAVLPSSAPRLEGRGRFQSYRFRGRANDRIVITMESESFDPYLHLARINGPSLSLVGNDDDGGEGTNSRLVATLAEDGEYLVVASSFFASDTSGYGPYTIRMGPCDSACAAFSDTPAPRSEASYQVAIRAQRRAIPPGGMVETELMATDSTLSDGAHFHAYWTQGVAGQTLRASLQSTRFDPYLALFRFENDSLVRLAVDDDGGEGTNALLEWPVDRNGSYVIFATAYSRSSSGTYVLNVEQGPESGHAAFLSTVATAAARSQLGQAFAARHRPLPLAQAVSAEMTDATPRLERRGRFQAYRFLGRANDRIVITLASEQFDPYLYLARINGQTMQIVGTDDDGGDGTNSRLVATLPATGEYLVVASAYSAADSTGVSPYSIKLDRCDDACAAYTPGARSPAAYQIALRSPRRTIPPGGSIEGVLESTDSTLSDGTRFHAYWVQGTQRQTLRAALQSPQFDAQLALFRQERDSLVFLADDDDGGEGTSALLEWPVELSGTYVVVATAFAQPSSGRYTLNVEQGPESAHEAFLATAAAAYARGQVGQALAASHRPLPMGQQLRAEMTAETPRLNGKSRFHSYRFSGRANDRVVVTMESEGFDPYLYLVLADERSPRIVGTDDDGGPENSSRLVATLPATGEYMVIATAFGTSDSTGISPYTVTLAPCDDSCAAETTSSPSTGAADASLQRVLRAPRLPLPLGQPRQARLVGTDSTLSDGSHFHAYALEPQAGATLRATLESTDFDPLLVLYRVEGDSLVRVASDDDGGEGLNALLTWTVVRPGRYVLVANSIARGATGAYTLSATITPAVSR